MIDFNEYIELNEAFNSEPYPVEYSVSGQTERYIFEEDPTHQYRIEINKADRSIPLGRDVRTVWIAHKNSGRVYRPIIGKFKDPRRVIATVLDVLNKYKDEGRLGSRVKGFAIRLQGQNFGAYAGFVNKIAKMYLRQQFDVKQDPVYDSENDANLVLINRKGTQFESVFSDYVDWSNAALTGNVAVTEPGSEQTNQSQEEQQEYSNKFKVGDLIAKDASRVYLKIKDVDVQNSTLYYVVDRLIKADNSVDSTGAYVPVYLIDAGDYTIYTPIAANFIPNNDLPNGTWLVKRTENDSGIYACQIIDADKSREITEYKIKCYGRYRNELATGTITSREIGGMTWIISEREPHFLDVPNTVVPKFKVGDTVAKPDSDGYLHITAIELHSGVMSYKTDRYFTVGDVLVDSDFYLPVATVDSMDYEIYQANVTTTEPSGPKWQVGDFIRKAEDVAHVNVYAHIIAIDNVGGVPTYVYDMFNIRDNVGTGRGRTEVSTLDAVRFVRHEKPKFVVGDTIQNANNTARFLKITDIGVAGTDLMYTYDVYLVESPTRPTSTSLSLSTSEIDPLYERFTIPVAQPVVQQASAPDVNVPVFRRGNIISRVRPSSSAYYYEVLEVETQPSQGEPYYKLKGFKKSSRRHNRSLDGMLRFSIAHHGYDIYDPRSEIFRNLNPHLNATVAPVVAAPTPAPTADNSGLIVVPNDVGAPFTTAEDIVVPAWYRVTLDGYSYYAFAYSKDGSRIQERQYTLNGDILSSGELTFRNFGEGDSYQRLDGPPVFKDSSEPHRFKVGDVFSLYGEEYTVIGFRGKFYILNDVSNFKEIKIADRNAVVVQTSVQPQPAQNATPAYPAKTREEHMSDFAKAKEEYGVVVGESVVDFMIRKCPAATVYDVCKAMFGEPNTDTGDGRKIWLNGDTITASQNGGSIHGAPLNRLTRQFKFGDGYVYHDYLMMKPSSQGGGATKKLFTESIPLYEKMGFKKVKVYANIDVGAAIWSRYGFKSYETMDQSSWDRFLSNRISRVKNLERSISRLDEFDSLHQAELQGVINLLEGFKQSGYFSDYPAMVCSLTVPNVEALFQEQLRQYCSGAKPNLKLNIGKMLMWGNGYIGELDLSDRKSYNRMARYVGLSTR